MILENIMTRPVVTVELDDSLRAIKEIVGVAALHQLLEANRHRCIKATNKPEHQGEKPA